MLNELIKKLESYDQHIATSDSKDGSWSELNYKKFVQLTKQIALHLQKLNLPKRAKVAILSESSKEYIPALLGLSLIHI